ncbi:MAG: tripartite tricarboxylate transporter substrate binding protein [Betaproteobacteria bacterium]|jgi:tripartite-type tricarboxylate transporter receptor subunit TctC
MKKIFTALLLAYSSCLFAQDYPNKPIKMIVPYPPGGVTDMATRAVSAKMSEAFGQAIIVENQPAAGGVVATNAMAKMPADGYTLMSAFDSFATNPFMYKGVQHDPLKDFAPISLMVKSPQVLVVFPGTGIKNMADLLKMSRAKADHFSFATPGAGTSSRLSTELFKQYAGIDSTLVTYKGGSQAMTDLLGGQVNAMIVSVSLVLQHIQSGRLTPIAVSSSKRIAQLPDVPPIADTFPGFEAQSWTGMVAPAGTPKAIIDKLNAALVKALNSSEFKEKFTSQGVEIVGSSPEGFADWMNKESLKWSQVIKQRKISIE